jgi:hypothetical protein
MKNGRQLIFTYWNEKVRGEHFSHPELRVYLYEGKHISATRLGDELFSLRSQCDEERGFHPAKAYALRAEIKVDGYHFEQALKLLRIVTKDISGWGEKPFLKALRNLRRLGAMRFIQADVGKGNDWIAREWIPRKFKRKAKAYYEATAAGLEVST